MSRLYYRCHLCGATGVKLWREYHVIASHNELKCRSCAEKKTKSKLDRLQIGDLVPAVPDEFPKLDGEIDTFWGVGSTPPWALEWWYNLPPAIDWKPDGPFQSREAWQAERDARDHGYAEQTKTRIAETVYVVKTDQAQRLWAEWHRVFPFEQMNPGYCETISFEPLIVVTVFFWRLNGKVVAFADATSRIVDHFAVDAWIEKTFVGVPVCNDDNTHQMLSRILGDERSAELEARLAAKREMDFAPDIVTYARNAKIGAAAAVAALTRGRPENRKELLTLLDAVFQLADESTP